MSVRPVKFHCGACLKAGMEFLAGSILPGTWFSESNVSTGVTNVSDSDTVTLTNTSGAGALRVERF